MTPIGRTPSGSLWSPLREATFASLWLAMLVSATGGWMHETGAGWLMTSLTPSPAIVALVQTANTLPIFLFALLAGALADRMDKRRFLIMTNTTLAVVVFVFAWLVHRGHITPALLIFFTFLIGSGAAFSAPAWQSLVPELVKHDELRNALALNSLGINISRALGPAAAGFLIAGVGMASPFIVNAASYLVVVAVLLFWRPKKPIDTTSREPLLAAITTGLRHAAHNQALKQTLLRAVGFFFPASALWALLPLIARQLPNADAAVYGSMTACIGAGAVAGALALPALRKRWDTHQLAMAGSVLLAIAIPMLGFSQSRFAVFASCAVSGAAWIAALTSFNLSAQTALPNWVRARGMSIFLMVFFGAMTIGSICWGQTAQAIGLGKTMAIAGAVLAVLALLTRNARLGAAEGLDLSSSMHWPAPVMLLNVAEEASEGPVMVTIEYRVPEENRNTFRELMNNLRHERYRDGAFEWGLHRGSDDAALWLEWFLVDSWEEHLRQHQRVTKADEQLQAQIRTLLSGDSHPVVKHWLGAN